MSNRRVISQEIEFADNFRALSIEARSTYNDLMLLTDDVGFTDNPFSLKYQYLGITRNSLDELAKAGYIIEFQSGVICIVHFLKMNILRNTKTTHKSEYDCVDIVNDIYFPHIECLEEENEIDNNVNSNENKNNCDGVSIKDVDDFFDNMPPNTTRNKEDESDLLF